MPFGRFFAYNLAGATAWASLMVTLAFFAGRVISLEQLVAWVTQFAILAVFILAALIFIPIWLESRQVKRAAEE